ncbi:MAG TPA: toll/interleukin-1 receptor domain-containing protein, partial [Candidatus Kapabacteria bacterium]|nr:toll/interleukin-1 receptor domain-containing protein [Candidatus Kapabacteria bacterium]
MRKGPIIYLSYAVEDQDTVKEVYDKLSMEGYNPWIAMKDILPGQNWEQEIHRALREAAFFLVFLSRKFLARAGLYYDEIERALKFSQEKPSDKIFIIPICLEECTIPKDLKHLQSLNLFERFNVMGQFFTFLGLIEEENRILHQSILVIHQC